MVLLLALPEVDAYPLFTTIYLGRKYRKLIPVLVLYVAGVWLALMYLGEDYFFDVLVGAAYAVAVYAAVRAWRKYFVRESSLSTADAAAPCAPPITPAVSAARRN